jgi:predicted short-subunit dehydrogenase-like oxidoreductase (DUF2520 family)
MRVVVIGAGNTAAVLGRLIKDAGHEIIQVFSRELFNAEDLAEQLKCRAVNDWEKISHDGQLYLVALSDRVVADLDKYWSTKQGMVVHTAGGLSKHVLKGVAKNYGVLYPLQSLRKEKAVYEAIPLLIDGNTEDDLAFIADFAGFISTTVRQADDAYRMHLHVAAVFVNNFTNHLYTLAEQYCVNTGVSFNLLKPLIVETAERILEFEPSMVQTGPAIRGDVSTMEKHLELLQEYPPLFDFYRLFSKSLQASLKPAFQL